MARLPELIPLAFNLPRPRLDDPETVLRSGLRPLLAGTNGTIGIVVPARGIPGLASLVRAAAEEIRVSGGEPVIVPAMGCEWGGVPEGWSSRLRALGLAGDDIPILAGDEPVMAAGLRGGEPIYVASRVKSLQGLFLLAGLSPRPRPAGPLESALRQMVAMDLGGTASSLIAHREGAARLSDFLRDAAAAVVPTLPLVGAAMVGHNGWGEIARLEVVPAEGMFEREEALLEELRPFAPRLPVRELDLLIVDEIGKDLSATGMDPWIVGRPGDRAEAGADYPAVRRLLVRRLTAQTAGNAFGVGMADLVTQSVMDGIDYRLTYAEALVTTSVDLAKIPMVFGTDLHAIEAALATLPDDDPAGLRSGASGTPRT